MKNKSKSKQTPIHFAVLEKTLESPLDSKSILKEISRGAVVQWITRLTTTDQKILKEISPEYSLEGLMLKLKLQYCDHLRRRADSLDKTDAGKD